MAKRLLLAILFLTLSLQAHGLVKLGSGVSSLTSGQVHPIAYLSIDPSRFSLTFTSVGFKHQYGYYSGYNSAFFYNFARTSLFEVGVGWGITYVQLGYRDSTDSDTEDGDEWSTGPAFKAFMHPIGPLFLGFQGTFGVGVPTLFLAVRDNVSFIVGVEF